jgi:delta 1-pyrroline-5-carboxylate dehydrogenase
VTPSLRHCEEPVVAPSLRHCDEPVVARSEEATPSRHYRPSSSVCADEQILFPVAVSLRVQEAAAPMNSTTMNDNHETPGRSGLARPSRGLVAMRPAASPRQDIALRGSTPDGALWRPFSFHERVRVAENAAAILRERAEEFARMITREGKVLDEARHEVAIGAEIIALYARSPEPRLEGPGRPLLFCLQPRNCSYDQLARLSAPNLLAGNVVMVKHAEKVPESSRAFERLWIEAGAPVGAFANLLISYD